MDTIRILPLDTERVQEFAALLQHWGDFTPPPSEVLLDQVRRARDHMGGEVFVALDASDAMLGYAQVGEHTMVGLFQALEIQALLVTKSMRGKGIGSRLLSHVEAWGRERSYPTILLSSQQHRRKAHKFYLRQGYKEFKRSLFFQKPLRS